MKFYARQKEVMRGQNVGLELDSLVVIGGAVESIGKYAFAHSNVEKAVIDVPVIEEGAFYDCANLEEIIFSDKVEEIGESAFYKCPRLRIIKFPKHLKKICNSAFAGCSSLEEIVLPKELEEIGNEAFVSCDSIYVVEINASLKKIGAYCFYKCPNLKVVNFNGRKIMPVLENKQEQEEIENGDSLMLGKHPFLGCDGIKFVNAKAYKANGSKRASMSLMETWLTGEASLDARLAEWILQGNFKKIKLF